MKTISQLAGELTEAMQYCGPLQTNIGEHTYIYGFNYAKAYKHLEKEITKFINEYENSTN